METTYYLHVENLNGDYVRFSIDVEVGDVCTSPRHVLLNPNDPEGEELAQLFEYGGFIRNDKY